ncbi:MAG: alpha/beta hydrolase [Chlamydiae bacterium]|nr:alpha/beta hydrolase [Chlamydiota bacterium]
MRKYFCFFFLVVTLLQAQEKILVCVHGFMRSKSNMSYFEKSFKERGWDVYLWFYPSRLKTIEEHGASLTDLLNFIAKRHPGEAISFVTHSMGGLVVRSAVNHEDCPIEAKIGRAVLIAPPNRGSAYGRFLNMFEPFRDIAGPYAGRQLMTTQEDGFDALGQFPSSMEVLVIAGTCGFNLAIPGKNDGKVGVSETRLSTPHEFKKVFAGHSWICHTPKTVEIASEFLEREETATSP